MNHTSPHLHLPTPARQVHRVAGHAALRGVGAEADWDPFAAIAQAFTDVTDWVEGAYESVTTWVAEHPALAATLAPLLIAL